MLLESEVEARPGLLVFAGPAGFQPSRYGCKTDMPKRAFVLVPAMVSGST